METFKSADAPFILWKESFPQRDKDTFVVEVPLRVADKSALLEALAREGRFPSYFGHNWDALNDCLCDFSWLDKKKVLIVHQDVPLAMNAKESRIYLEILISAIQSSRQNGSDCELIGAFPFGTEEIIDTILNGDSA